MSFLYQEPRIVVLFLGASVEILQWCYTPPTNGWSWKRWRVSEFGTFGIPCGLVNLSPPSRNKGLIRPYSWKSRVGKPCLFGERWKRFGNTRVDQRLLGIFKLVNQRFLGSNMICQFWRLNSYSCNLCVAKKNTWNNMSCHVHPFSDVSNVTQQMQIWRFLITFMKWPKVFS